MATAQIKWKFTNQHAYLNIHRFKQFNIQSNRIIWLVAFVEHKILLSCKMQRDKPFYLNSISCWSVCVCVFEIHSVCVSHERTEETIGPDEKQLANSCGADFYSEVWYVINFDKCRWNKTETGAANKFKGYSHRRK